ncbi:MAG: FMN-binding protein [Eubacteriales bacterium]|nr:FMN-binding protein [Eubacteriales bacterium]
MRHQDFWGRMASLAIAVIAVCVYQANALQWQQETEANQQAVAEANAQNSGAVSYQDGVYIGEGEGFGGTITAQVTVTDGEIAYIEITDASNEDAAYLDQAMQIVDNIIAAQTPEVDTISGATFSSTGIKTAVQQALEGAAET